jgi:hypothetical protein
VDGVSQVLIFGADLFARMARTRMHLFVHVVTRPRGSIRRLRHRRVSRLM